MELNFLAILPHQSLDTAVAGVLVAPEWWGRNEYTEQRAA